MSAADDFRAIHESAREIAEVAISAAATQPFRQGMNSRAWADIEAEFALLAEMIGFTITRKEDAA